MHSDFGDKSRPQGALLKCLAEALCWECGQWWLAMFPTSIQKKILNGLISSVTNQCNLWMKILPRYTNTWSILWTKAIMSLWLWTVCWQNYEHVMSLVSGDLWPLKWSLPTYWMWLSPSQNRLGWMLSSVVKRYSSYPERVSARNEFKATPI
jgi:hypothetical protein